MDNIILSIVIPTHNSEDVLGLNLDSILPQVNNRKDVEIIILNNSSTDGTGRVIEEYALKYPSTFTVVTKNVLIPSQENFKDGVHRANGQYVLLLGDDDILSPFFIDSVIPLLDGKIGILHFNRIEGESGFQNNKLFRAKLVDGHCVDRYDNFRDYLNEYDTEYCFMSSVIFLKSVWVEGERFVQPEKPYYGYFWYATITFGAINYPSVYLYFPLVIQRIRSHEWGSKWPLYWMVGMFSIYKDLDRYLPGVYKDFYIKYHDVNKDHFISLFAGISKNKNLYKMHIKDFYAVLNSRERILFNVVLHTPCQIARLCQKVFRVLNL